MASGRDFHSRPFDEGTRAKLRLFKNYVQEWLPVFIRSSPQYKRLNIVDFFAGPGRDMNGEPGSPLIALRELRQYSNDIRRNGSRICLLLNERAQRKARMLSTMMRAQAIPKDVCEWTVEALDFDLAFAKYCSLLEGCANLIFLDQTGVKFISDDVFRTIINIPRTDFIFFIASSSLRRFENHPYFQKHLSIPKGAISSREFNDTHRAVTEHYRSLVPSNMEYYLGSFSIKKGSNLYGIIFGSKHPLGMEKFLRVCWKEDQTTGEANFDIDRDMIDKQQPRLFPDMDKPRKLDLFEKELRKMLTEGSLTTDRGIYLYTLQEGFLPRHGRKVLATLLKDGIISMSGNKVKPRVSLDGYKEPRAFKVLKDGNF